MRLGMVRSELPDLPLDEVARWADVRPCVDRALRPLIVAEV